LHFTNKVFLGHALAHATDGEANVLIVSSLGFRDRLLSRLLAARNTESTSKGSPTGLGRRLFFRRSASTGFGLLALAGG
jgi:hypothetical protein